MGFTENVHVKGCRKKHIERLRTGRETTEPKEFLKLNYSKKNGEMSMSLRFIYGKSGTGKTTYCFNEIKKIADKEKIYIITPEQFSYSAEKKLLEELEGVSINAEVITFNRMASRVFTEVGGINDVVISKSAKAMLIYSILDKEKKNLKFIGNSNDNIELIEKEITELKKHNITVEKLEQGIDKIDSPILKTKLQDIYNVYKIYEEKMQNNFIDEEDLLTKLYNKLPESKMFDGATVYIDEFSGFTKQEYNIVTEILKKAKQVNVTICTDSLMDNLEKERDIFYFNKQFAKLLTESAQNVDEKLEKPIFLNEKYRFKNKELKHLEENIYNYKYQKYKEENKNIKLFIASSPYTEIEHVAQEINKLTREENYNYRDIAVITQNIDSVNSIAKAIFSKHNIPVFIDEKNEITENIIIKYVLSILEIFTTNWNTESVLNYIKSGFLNLERDQIYLVENYCKKYGINRNKWHKNAWRENEELRKQIVEPLLELKAKLDSEKTTKSITENLYKYLVENNIQEKLNEKIEKLKSIGEEIIAKDYQASLDILINVFDEIVEFFGDEKTTLDRYKEILKVGLRNKEVGKIPQYIEQVIIGDVNRSRTHKVKAVFIIGVNDGSFPSVNKNEGYINDEDRNILKEIEIELAKTTTDNLFEEQFNIYKAFTTAEEKLYISYSSSNKEGAALRPSIIISKIKKIFPKLKEESDIISKKSVITNQNATFEELLKNIRKLKDGEHIDDIWQDVYNWYNANEYWKAKLQYSLNGLNYTNKAEKITDENIQKLYGNTLKTSISRLEQYRKCPFSFHLKYGLKIKEEEEYKIKPLDTGSFMHEVVDTFFEEVANVKTIEEEQIEEIVERIINEKLNLDKNYIFSSSLKFIVLTNRLKKAIKTSIKYIVYQMKLSDFTPIGHELEFSEKIDNVELVGKIDRLDMGKNEEGEFIRIIDYKSSEQNIDLNKMLAGTQIQLITYIDAISKKENKQPAGMLYFNLIDPIIKENKNLSDEEIESKIRKSFKMQGLILADVKVVKMMDKTLDKGYSDIIPAYLDKDGNLSTGRSSTITKDEFTNLQEKIQKIIKQISKEILTGNIEIKPMYDKKTKTSSCNYCAYKTICSFNQNINQFNIIQNKTKEEILNEIKEN